MTQEQVDKRKIIKKIVDAINAEYKTGTRRDPQGVFMLINQELDKRGIQDKAIRSEIIQFVGVHLKLQDEDQLEGKQEGTPIGSEEGQAIRPKSPPKRPRDTKDIGDLPDDFLLKGLRGELGREGSKG